MRQYTPYSTDSNQPPHSLAMAATQSPNASWREGQPAAKGLLPEAAADPVGAVRSGLPYASLERVREALGAPDHLLARALSVSERTLYRRRKKEGRLSSAESDRLLLLSETFELARRALDDEAAARRWLREPDSLLGEESPLEHMDTLAGAQEVRAMLLSIEHSMPV